MGHYQLSCRDLGTSLGGVSAVKPPALLCWSQASRQPKSKGDQMVQHRVTGAAWHSRGPRPASVAGAVAAAPPFCKYLPARRAPPSRARQRLLAGLVNDRGAHYKARFSSVPVGPPSLWGRRPPTHLTLSPLLSTGSGCGVPPNQLCLATHARTDQGALLLPSLSPLNLNQVCRSRAVAGGHAPSRRWPGVSCTQTSWGRFGYLLEVLVVEDMRRRILAQRCQRHCAKLVDAKMVLDSSDNDGETRARPRAPPAAAQMVQPFPITLQAKNISCYRVARPRDAWKQQFTQTATHSPRLPSAELIRAGDTGECHGAATAQAVVQATDEFIGLRHYRVHGLDITHTSGLVATGTLNSPWVTYALPAYESSFHPKIGTFLSTVVIPKVWEQCDDNSDNINVKCIRITVGLGADPKKYHKLDTG
ncbi:hypothetical protein GGX14DRAFT_409264 [Mycena pura]|uniref:Uncharacterized protein n=1 Tax=Mycena pura TaxID=153505 RepID=A0AAD6Y0H8_9AGAR|nr:hypothetical protein GGX14DRAFT_409264 [Mycena pura]